VKLIIAKLAYDSELTSDDSCLTVIKSRKELLEDRSLFSSLVITKGKSSLVVSRMIHFPTEVQV
jgi:hypothetical protein